MASIKLTLTVKPEVVKMAKQYARKHNTSVSATFSRVIRALVVRERSQAVAVPSGSALEKLSGIITLPEGKTADDVLFEALVERYGLEEETRRAN